MSEDPFRFSIALEVCWRDLDPLGHVNNAVYFTYLETARFRYLRDVCGITGPPQEIGFVLAEASCTYLSPLSLGERVTVWIRVSELGNSSFVFEYRVEGEDGRLAATARTVQVCYDLDAGRPRPLPAEWRERITTYESDL
ncbi:MAG TPA: acyl-CoA thioesterase [Chloroflexi bacterium]|nr:acyl-CoA thioesterase [Chloroflexota bacterium]